MLVVAMAVGTGCVAGVSGARSPSWGPHLEMHPPAPGEVRWTDGLWAQRFRLLREVSLWEVQRALENPQNAAVLANFRVAAGLDKGKYLGKNWGDGDCYKWLEAVARVYGVTRDSRLDRLLDEWITVIARAQAPDGYISMNVQLTDMTRFANPHHHEMYNMGHLLTAAAVHHRMTGKDSFLAVARRLGDFLVRTFGPRPPELAHFGWNPSNIMGLVDLYRATGDRRYLDLAGTFVSMRGSAPGGSDLTQDHVPLREETQAVGHAVCACYLYAGAADVVAETGEQALMDALERIWQSACTRRMYITGAVGSFWKGTSPRGDSVHEAFGCDYELPPRTAYAETCANIGSAMWNRRMLALSGEARFADVMERVLYNAGLSPIGVNGKGFFYCNPLERTDRTADLSYHHTAERWSVHRCFCCPPQVVRTLGKVHEWAYGLADDGVWVHLYGGSVLETDLAGGRLRIEQRTDYPWDGHVRLIVHAAPARDLTLRLRIPGWAEAATLKVNGQEADGVEAAPGTYASLRRTWQIGDTVALDLPMPVRLMAAHPEAESLVGRVAVARGPVVYCLESHDVPDGVPPTEVALPAGASLEPEWREDYLGGVVVLKGKGVRARGSVEPVLPAGAQWKGRLYRPVPRGSATVPVGKALDVTLIPYYAWANRGPSQMAVWLPLWRPAEPM
jgi:DUF1680 family protein